MRFTPSIIVFLFFICSIVYGLPVSFGTNNYESPSKGLVSKVASRFPFLGKKKSQILSPESQEPPIAPETIQTFIERFNEMKNVASSLIAKKHGAFEVYASLPFERNDVVIKIVYGTNVEAEMKNWAQAGYLLAYATENNPRTTTYLILKVATPKQDVPPGESCQNLMHDTRETSGKSYALASPRGYEFRQNFVLKIERGGLSVKLFDWERGYKDKIGAGRLLSEISHVEL